MDYLFRWMELRFLSGKKLPLSAQPMAVVKRQSSEEADQTPVNISQYHPDSYEVGDAPLCVTCGSLMVRTVAATNAEIVEVRVAARDSGRTSSRLHQMILG